MKPRSVRRIRKEKFQMQLNNHFVTFVVKNVLQLKNINMKKINEWWNKDLFVINIGIYEIPVDNGMICSLILIIIGLKSLL